MGGQTHLGGPAKRSLTCAASVVVILFAVSGVGVAVASAAPLEEVVAKVESVAPPLTDTVRFALAHLTP